MPTTDQIREWAADFEREYPEELPERLRWLTERLGVRPYLLLRLMGFSCAQAEELSRAGVDWDAVLAQSGEEAGWWLDGQLGYLLDLFQLNWQALRDRLHQPADPRFLIVRPGGEAVRPEDMPPELRDTVLLTLIADGGPRSTEALVAYLSQPADQTAHS